MSFPSEVFPKNSFVVDGGISTVLGRCTNEEIRTVSKAKVKTITRQLVLLPRGRWLHYTVYKQGQGPARLTFIQKARWRTVTTDTTDTLLNAKGRILTVMGYSLVPWWVYIIVARWFPSHRLNLWSHYTLRHTEIHNRVWRRGRGTGFFLVRRGGLVAHALYTAA